MTDEFKRTEQPVLSPIENSSKRAFNALATYAWNKDLIDSSRRVSACLLGTTEVENSNKDSGSVKNTASNVCNSLSREQLELFSAVTQFFLGRNYEEPYTVAEAEEYYQAAKKIWGNTEIAGNQQVSAALVTSGTTWEAAAAKFRALRTKLNQVETSFTVPSRLIQECHAAFYAGLNSNPAVPQVETMQAIYNLACKQKVMAKADAIAFVDAAKTLVQNKTVFATNEINIKLDALLSSLYPSHCARFFQYWQGHPKITAAFLAIISSIPITFFVGSIVDIKHGPGAWQTIEDFFASRSRDATSFLEFIKTPGAIYGTAVLLVVLAMVIDHYLDQSKEADIAAAVDSGSYSEFLNNY